MNVLSVSFTAQPGGIDRVIRVWLEHSWNLGFRSHAIVRDVPGMLELQDPRAEEQITRVAVKGKIVGVRNEIANFIAVERLVQKQSWACINPHDPYAYFHLARSCIGRSTSLQVVPTVHQLLGRTAGIRKVRLILALAQRFVFWRSKRIIAVSKGRAAELEALGIPREKIRVVYNGVPLPENVEPAEEREIWRKVNDIPSRAFVVGFAGRLSGEKGIARLLEAFHLARQQSKDNLILAVAGQGPEEDKVRSLVSMLCLSANVRLLGHVSNMRGFYNGIDLFCLLSDDEGISMAILEAMSYGLPVLATAVGGTPEVVEHGVCGWLTDRNRIEDACRVIQNCVEDRALVKRCGDAGLARLKATFSVEAFVRKTGEVFREVEGIRS